MTITPKSLNKNLNDALYQFFSDPLLEGKVLFAYKDGAGIPTIGVGYALVVDTGGSPKWAIRSNYKKDFLAAGIKLSTAQLTDLDAKLADTVKILNGGSGENSGQEFRGQYTYFPALNDGV